MAQPVHRRVQLSLHRAFGQTECGRDLAELEPLVMAHDEDEPLPGWQPRDLLLEHFPEFPGIGSVFRAGTFFRCVQHLVFGLFAERCGCRRCLPATVIDTRIHDNPIHPRRQLRLLPEAVEGSKDLYEDFLGDVFGVVVVPRELVGHAIHHGPVPLDERRRRLLEHVRDAVAAAGLEPLRADEEMTGGVIHKPMFERLMLCHYAVADTAYAVKSFFFRAMADIFNYHTAGIEKGMLS